MKKYQQTTVPVETYEILRELKEQTKIPVIQLLVLAVEKLKKDMEGKA